MLALHNAAMKAVGFNAHEPVFVASGIFSVTSTSPGNLEKIITYSSDILGQQVCSSIVSEYHVPMVSNIFSIHTSVPNKVFGTSVNMLSERRLPCGACLGARLCFPPCFCGVLSLPCSHCGRCNLTCCAVRVPDRNEGDASEVTSPRTTRAGGEGSGGLAHH